MGCPARTPIAWLSASAATGIASASRRSRVVEPATVARAAAQFGELQGARAASVASGRRPASSRTPASRSRVSAAAHAVAGRGQHIGPAAQGALVGRGPLQRRIVGGQCLGRLALSLQDAVPMPTSGSARSGADARPPRRTPRGPRRGGRAGRRRGHDAGRPCSARTALRSYRVPRPPAVGPSCQTPADRRQIAGCGVGLRSGELPVDELGEEPRDRAVVVGVDRPGEVIETDDGRRRSPRSSRQRAMARWTPASSRRCSRAANAVSRAARGRAWRGGVRRCGASRRCRPRLGLAELRSSSSPSSMLLGAAHLLRLRVRIDDGDDLERQLGDAEAAADVAAMLRIVERHQRQARPRAAMEYRAHRPRARAAGDRRPPRHRRAAGCSSAAPDGDPRARPARPRARPPTTMSAAICWRASSTPSSPDRGRPRIPRVTARSASGTMGPPPGGEEPL